MVSSWARKQFFENREMGSSPSANLPQLLKKWITLNAAILLCLSFALAQTDPGTDANRVFKVGDGVSPPVAIYQPAPEYSKEARHAKYQGTCVLWLIVGTDGRPRDIRVRRTLGLGLDEKAIEAVKQWKFKPAMKDRMPVAVQISVQVDFHLYVDTPHKR